MNLRRFWRIRTPAEAGLQSRSEGGARVYKDLNSGWSLSPRKREPE